MGFTRNIFTWENGHEGEAFVQERLDRACAMLEWRELFPYSRVSLIIASYSNHVLIILNTQVEHNQVRTRRILRLSKEKWATNPDCEAIIHHAWTTMVATGSPMYILFEKNQAVQDGLSGLE